MNIMRQLELEHMKSSLPDFGIGDSVDVHYLIREGDKERVQLFSGTVIAFHGSGISRTVKVRRIVAGEGVERTFALHSSRVADVTVKGRGVVRRAKLFFLREREGKKTRLTRNLGRMKWPRSGAGSGLKNDAGTDAPAAE
jgi:large subunit ribosomal protein L19